MTRIAPIPREAVEPTPRKLGPAGRLWVVIRQRHRCAACKTWALAKDFEVDHIIPLELGGSNDDDNLQALCVPCHKAKTKFDIKALAKARRIRKREAGIKKPSRLKSRGFDKTRRRTMAGKVEVRT